MRTLVFPSQVTDSASQLSVLAPVGAALLGLKVGSTIHWELPGGASTHPEVLSYCTSRKPLANSTANSAA